jgi:BirA family biotin operon repressor/biotin-[acetyl-CoA-carboxylase] ligase
MKKQNSNLIKIVKILSDMDYHDGDSIGEMLGITRTAVWKYIQKLDNYGIEISSVKSKGYALKEPLTLLDEHNIASNVHNKNIRLEVFETINSTNNYLRDSLYRAHNKIALSEHQSHGKGRMDRKWHAPFGQNIYLSYCYCFKKDLSELAGLSMVVCIALIEELQKIIGEERLMAKWPNDVLLRGQKLVGILIEVQAEANGLCYATIGIGINVNMAKAEGIHIPQPWIALKEATGKNLDRNLLSASVINRLNDYLNYFQQEGIEPFLDKWDKVDILRDQEVILLSGEEEIEGVAKGINSQGNLLIEIKEGVVRSFSSGDTSIKKKSFPK